MIFQAREHAKTKGVLVPLWEGSKPVFTVPGQQPAFAIAPEKTSGQGNSNARGQSSEASIGAIGGRRKRRLKLVPGVATPSGAAVELRSERHCSERSSAGDTPGLPKPEGDERPFSETDDATLDGDESLSPPRRSSAVHGAALGVL